MLRVVYKCWRDLLIEQRFALKLKITFMLKRQRPMDVDTDAYIETDVDVYTDVSGI